MGFTTGLGHGIGIEIGNGSTLRQNGIEPDKKTFGETFGVATGVSDPRLQKSGSETTAQEAKQPLEPGTMTPISTLGPQATSIKTRLRNGFFESGRLPKTRSVPRSLRRSFRTRVRIAGYFPRVALWAGKQSPFSAANRLCRISARQGSLLHDEGKWNDDVFDHASMPSSKSLITLILSYLQYFCEIVIPALRFYFNQRLTAMVMPMVAAIRRTHRAGMRWASFAPTIEPGTDPAISQTASDQSTCPWMRK
jgi:hypothetical protein